MRVHMRVLFASTQSTGHFAPLIPFAQACRDAGHDGARRRPAAGRGARLPRRARRTSPWRAAAPERLDEVRRMMSGRAGFERIAIATTELFVGSHAKAALPDMLRAGRALAAGRDRCARPPRSPRWWRPRPTASPTSASGSRSRRPTRTGGSRWPPGRWTRCARRPACRATPARTGRAARPC